jgi:hypothetical protein
MRERGVYFGRYVMMGIAFLAFFALFTYVFILLWNWLVPELFSGPAVNYWQGLGILALAKIIFTGLGHGYRSRHYPGKSHWHPDPHTRNEWKQKFREKMREKHNPSGDARSRVETNPPDENLSDQK